MNRIERNFEVGDLVFLILHPYRQSLLKKNNIDIVYVEYDIELLERRRMNNVFHVSFPKVNYDHHVTTLANLPHSN